MGQPVGAHTPKSIISVAINTGITAPGDSRRKVLINCIISVNPRPHLSIDGKEEGYK